MMIKSIFFILLFFPLLLIGQQSKVKIDSLKQELYNATTDSSKLRVYERLAEGIRFSNTKASLAYSDQALDLAKKSADKTKYAQILSLKGATLLEIGRIPESLEAQFESLQISEESKDTATTALILNRIGNTHMELGDYPQANKFYILSKDLFAKIDDNTEFNELSNIGNIYELMGVSDSAMYYQQGVIDYINSKQFIRDGKVTVPEAMFRMGNALKLNGDTLQALNYYKKGIVEAYHDNDNRNLAMNNLLLARLYQNLNQPDSSLKYTKAALEAGNSVLFRKGIYEASLMLSELYSKEGKYDSAYAYISKANIQKDSLTGNNQILDLQRIVLREQEQRRSKEALAIQEMNTFKQYALLAGLVVFLIIAFILYYNNRQKQKSNKTLTTTLTNLKATQSQLIQSEKMASLGELTAGIAHEIQNPLNFVNNFSEVSNELLQEIQEERNKRKEERDEELVGEILHDIKQNLEKINHHGKRADAIVKGMLQHSRSSSGEKQLTDINALCDEYLRLAYHGLRAKDKSFNATLETDFDTSLKKINIVPQEMGRVILNLINNAFYAVSEKKSQMEDDGTYDFDPTVKISTNKTANGLEIKVKDNGNGMPKSVQEKIFHPFFTTKPSGKGTGLGLSLSYDIIKAHNGQINVQTLEGENTNFTILLPY
ncbi:His Kinase A (phospho-acceptor) domain-containing protein [Flavobacteriaceae bacterium MAR_2010_188]|nr:His Kinase A (phospho-acceptor) domain-containing protein [Flavobacteriaceae bacterium MAR_2010_188]